jgi:type IV secretory pathway VirB9-like protein
MEKIKHLEILVIYKNGESEFIKFKDQLSQNVVIMELTKNKEKNNISMIFNRLS